LLLDEVVIDHDKALHMACAPWCGLAAMGASAVVDWPLWLLAALGVLAAAIGREVFNAMTGGPFDWADVIYTIAGGVPVVVAAWA
jgi:hypothetical protein